MQESQETGFKSSPSGQGSSSPSEGYGSSGLELWRRITDIPLTALALGSLPILLLELVSHRLSSSDRAIVQIVNILVLAAFSLDYVVEFILATNRSLYIRREWTSLLIVLSQAVALLPALALLGFLRAIRGVRPVIYLLRLVGIGASRGAEIRKTFRKNAVGTAVSIAGLVWVSSAVAFTLVEDVGPGRRVPSFADALWWSATTISTVGYGDVYPVTAIGRVIAVVTMIVGVSTFGVLTAGIARYLMTPDKQE